jgi:hypothetical protein
MTDDLPEGWVREFEGRHGAEFFHDPRGVAVQVVPRYDPPGGRASQSAPTQYLVRLRRPYSDRVGFPVEVATVDSFENAVATAREFMVRFSDGFVRREASRVTAEALSAVAEYSDDRLVDLLVDRTGGSLRAVVHADPDPVPVYGVESGGTIAATPVAALCDQFRSSTDELGAVVETGGVHATIAVLEGVTVVWIPEDEDRGTLVAVGPDAEISIPGLVEECTELLAERQASSGA